MDNRVNSISTIALQTSTSTQLSVETIEGINKEIKHLRELIADFKVAALILNQLIKAVHN